ncbi:hypothetical protein ACQZ45_18890 [Agrobacterium sp. 16-2014-1-2a]
MGRRHKIKVRHGGKIDTDAIVGFDPPLRTFFLHAFIGSAREVWLGTMLEEFTSLQAIIQEARRQGCEIAPIGQKLIVEMVELAAQHLTPSLAEKLGIVR